MPRILRKGIPVIAVLALGGVVAAAMMSSRERAKRQRPEVLPPLVEVMQTRPVDESIAVTATGTVVAAREVNLQPEVSGRVTEVSPSFVPGGIVTRGDILAWIDPSDYQAVVKQHEAQVQDVLHNLEVEKGNQVVARQEWELASSGDISGANRSLMLREPHLRRLEAGLVAARSTLAKARRDVERTVIRAPFNAVVRQENVERGQVLNQQSSIGVLVGTDAYWVRANVPTANLKYIALPDAQGRGGAAARITHDLGRGSTVEREGRVVRVLADVEEQGKMARLLVKVDDPLGLGGGRKSLPLLLGAFVKVELDGVLMKNVFVLPRAVIHEGDKVWIVTEDDLLNIGTVEIAWRREADVVVAGGLSPGERIVTSHIGTPAEGIALRVGE